MTVVPSRRLVSEGLQPWLKTVTGRPWGLMQGDQTVIDETVFESAPCGLLEPLPGATLIGSWGGSWKQAELPYNLLTFGVDIQSAEALADLTLNAYLDLSIPMAISGFNIIDRRPDDIRDTPEEVATKLWSVRQSVILYVEAV